MIDRQRGHGSALAESVAGRTNTACEGGPGMGILFSAMGWYRGKICRKPWVCAFFYSFPRKTLWNKFWILHPSNYLAMGSGSLWFLKGLSNPVIFSVHFLQDSWWSPEKVRSPPVNTAIGQMVHWVRWFTPPWKWWCSMATLVYHRLSWGSSVCLRWRRNWLQRGPPSGLTA